jgi:hypothetical protein
VLFAVLVFGSHVRHGFTGDAPTAPGKEGLQPTADPDGSIGIILPSGRRSAAPESVSRDDETRDVARGARPV